MVSAHGGLEQFGRTGVHWIRRFVDAESDMPPDHVRDVRG